MSPVLTAPKRAAVAVAHAPRALAGHDSRLDRALSTGRRRRLATVVVAVLLVLALAAGIWFFLSWNDRRAVESARTEGLRASSEAMTRLLSYDYRTLDADLAATDTVTTGDFGQQYRDLAGQLIRPNAADNQVVTKAEVVGSSVQSAEADRLVTLLYINQSTTGKDQPTPRIDRSRATVTTVLQDGRWLISDLVPV